MKNVLNYRMTPQTTQFLMIGIWIEVMFLGFSLLYNL